MSRTLSGNLTGRAASTQRREDMSQRLEEAFHQGAAEWADREYWPLVETLKKIDSNFEDWFWSRPEQTKGEMVSVMEQRINELCIIQHSTEV